MKNIVDYGLLYDLVYEDNVEELQKQFDKHLDIDIHDTDTGDDFDRSLWDCAISESKIKSIEFFLNKGTSVDRKDRSFKGSQPIHSAVINEDIEVIKLLMSHGADINARDNEGLTPLCMRLRFGGTEHLQELMLLGADVFVKDHNNNTALHYAAEPGDDDAIKLLIKNGLDVNAKNNNLETPLHVAAKMCRFNIINTLLQAGANIETVDKLGFTPLHIVCFNTIERDDITKKTIEALIQAGANVNVQSNVGMTPLAIATRCYFTPSVEALIAGGADIHTKNNDNAFCFWKKEKPSNKTLLHRVIELDNEAIADVLINAGININAQDDNLKTALHYAVESENVHLVNFLIESGANPELVDINNNIPLHCALITKRKNKDVIHFLIDMKINLNIQGQHGNTALHYAVKEQLVETVQHLVQSGVNITLKNDGHKMAIHYAKSKKIKQLLDITK